MHRRGIRPRSGERGTGRPLSLPPPACRREDRTLASLAKNNITPQGLVRLQMEPRRRRAMWCFVKLGGHVHVAVATHRSARTYLRQLYRHALPASPSALVSRRQGKVSFAGGASASSSSRSESINRQHQPPRLSSPIEQSVYCSHANSKLCEVSLLQEGPASFSSSSSS